MSKDYREEIPAHHRKDAHLDLAMAPLAQTNMVNSFDRLRLAHCALPEIALNQIDLTSQFLGYSISAPLFIGAMTGGTSRADGINAALAEVAQSPAYRACCWIAKGWAAKRAIAAPHACPRT